MANWSSFLYMQKESSQPQAILDLPDADLLERYKNEQRQEFIGELYRRYRHLVMGMAFKYLKNREEAEDMVSYVFTLLIEKLPSKDVRSFKQYLYGIVRNECLAKYRKIRKEGERQQEYTNFENNLHSFVETDPKLSLVSEQTMEQAVEQAIQTLGEEQRICIHKFFFEGRSYKEIADQTGFDLKSVKSYLQNGKRNLRNQLEEYRNNSNA